MSALANPALGLEHLIVPNGAPLYHTELDYIRRESRADLRFEVRNISTLRSDCHIDRCDPHMKHLWRKVHILSIGQYHK